MPKALRINLDILEKAPFDDYFSCHRPLIIQALDNVGKTPIIAGLGLSVALKEAVEKAMTSP